MEIPYKGRAVINDHITSLEIIIPVKRNWFIILFLCVWLCGWFAGESMVLVTVSSQFLKHNPVQLFLLFWVILWTICGFFAISFFFWNLRGKEIITFEHSQLTIKRKGSVFFRTKIYDMNEVKDLRVQDGLNETPMFGYRNNNFLMNMGGVMRFDYGMRTIRFGAGLEEAEGKYILQQLVEKHYIKSL
jgi:hypothetical protein